MRFRQLHIRILTLTKSSDAQSVSSSRPDISSNLSKWIRQKHEAGYKKDAAVLSRLILTLISS